MAVIEEHEEEKELNTGKQHGGTAEVATAGLAKADVAAAEQRGSRASASSRQEAAASDLAEEMGAMRVGGRGEEKGDEGGDGRVGQGSGLSEESETGGGSGDGHGETEEFEDALTEEQQIQRQVAEADLEKMKGNSEYSKGRFEAALSHYDRALLLCPDHTAAGAAVAGGEVGAAVAGGEQAAASAAAPAASAAVAEARAAYYSNKAICLLHLKRYEEAVQASSDAIQLKPQYFKAILRRAEAQERLDKMEEALADYKRAIELDRSNKVALSAIRRIEPIVEERREKLKEEMLGKLKDLGNTLLGNFGMSLDNFKAVKDPTTGSYSISFQQ